MRVLVWFGRASLKQQKSFRYNIIYIFGKRKSFQDPFYFEHELFEEICEQELVTNSTENGKSTSSNIDCTLIYIPSYCYEYDQMDRLYMLLDQWIMEQSVCFNPRIVT